MKHSTTQKVIDLRNSSITKNRDRMYNKFDEHQQNFFHSIQSNVFSFCEAAAGSGKPTVAAAALLDMLVNGNIDKIVYVRVADDRAQSIGYYPGSLEEKTDIYWTPFCQALESLGLTKADIDELKLAGQIETTLDINLRGCNINRAGVILDEVQNADFYTLKLIFTRLSDNCHIAVIGDGNQCDNKNATNDYLDYCNHLAESCMGNKCKLVSNFRGHFSKIAESYKKVRNDSIGDTK